METFLRLFGSLLALVYHCFDRIVIRGYLPLLSRPEHIVHFFRDVQGLSPKCCCTPAGRAAAGAAARCTKRC